MTFDRAMLLLGIVIGILLLFFGIYLYRQGIYAWRLSFCIGFGIILGAFGTVANVKTKLWTITGAGATALILYWITAPAQQYTVGLINGDFPDGTTAFVRDTQDIPGGFMENKKYYRMVLLGDQIQSSFLEVEIRSPGERNSPTIKVKADYVNKLITHNKMFTWSMHDKKLFDENDQPVPTSRFSARGQTTTYAMNWLSPALAMVNDRSRSSLSNMIAADNLGLLAEKLLSKDYQIRRDARNSLVQADLSAVQPVLDVLSRRADPSSEEAFDFYQVLINIMRKNEINPRKISESLTDQDVAVCIKGVGSQDREVSTLATEFLHGISDKRALNPSLQLLRSTRNQDVQRNAVLVIQSFYSNLNPTEQREVAGELRAVSVESKARAQIDSFLPH